MYKVFTEKCDIIVNAEKWEIFDDGRVVFYDLDYKNKHKAKAIFNLNNILGFSEAK